MSTSLTRPTTMVEVRSRQSRMMTKEGIQRALAFQPQPTDVIITPYAKSGTTWVQQIVHGLRTRGDMNFDEITSVIPWLEMAHDLGASTGRAAPCVQESSAVGVGPQGRALHLRHARSQGCRGLHVPLHGGLVVRAGGDSSGALRS